MDNFNKINIRLKHPNLYRSMMVFTFVNIGLGICFHVFTPTFNPYGIDKAIVGWIFLTLGVTKLFFLNFYRNLKIVRLITAMAIAFTMFWGIGTLTPVFQGKASPQLFILYTGLSVLNVFQLIEPAINPISKVIKEKKKR